MVDTRGAAGLRQAPVYLSCEARNSALECRMNILSGREALMGSERYPLLLLLATVAVKVSVGAVHAGSPTPSERAGIVGALRASVQNRVASLRFSNPDPPATRELAQQLAQWFNFPNFLNQNCFRGYWRNC
jgi:hypothetical protein